MSKLNKYTFGDLTYKILSRSRDSLWKLYWLISLGKIGKGSYLKPGVVIIGNPKRVKIGKNFKIWHRCILTVKGGFISIGNDGLLGIDSIINASAGKVIIGNNVAIAPQVQIFSYSHHYELSKKYNECYKIADVVIEDNVLIGAGTIILPGVTIGKGSIVGASSVVTKDIPPNMIAAGSPAVVIKQVS